MINNDRDNLHHCLQYPPGGGNQWYGGGANPNGGNWHVENVPGAGKYIRTGGGGGSIIRGHARSAIKRGLAYGCGRTLETARFGNECFAEEDRTDGDGFSTIAFRFNA